MKKLILTFATTLVSLISFTQTYINTLDIDTLTINQTVFVHNAQILTVINSSGSNVIIKTYSDEFITLATFYNNQADYTKSLSDSVIYLQMHNTGTNADYNITVIFTESASTNENTLTREELKVYPSPSMSDIRISFSADKTDMVVNVFSLNGQLVYQDDNKREVGIVNVLELNVSNWQQGTYLIQCDSETLKFVR